MDKNHETKFLIKVRKINSKQLSQERITRAYTGDQI